MTTVLCLCGSLRQRSYNRAALEAAKLLAPKSVRLRIFDLGEIPLFNPDMEGKAGAAVTTLYQAVAGADGILIASPEYAHGISGVLKNALDWLVSDQSFPKMPVGLINTSPRASHALAAMREVLITMSANVVEPACIALPLLSSGFGTKEIVADEALSNALRQMLAELIDEITTNPRLATVEKWDTQ